MFETLRRLYLEGRLTDAGLQNAVRMGWIAEEQKTEIQGEKRNE